MYKKNLNVMLDLETLSLRPTAAIIEIAAEPFNLDGSEVTKFDGKPLSTRNFERSVDATTCAMYGFDFDQETIKWWANNAPANHHFTFNYGSPIETVLMNLAKTINEWKKETGFEIAHIWAQGADFDIAILRYAFSVVLGSDYKLPWKHDNVRDARSYFLEAAAMFKPNVPKPTDLIVVDGVHHTALADVWWSIKAVQTAYGWINEVLLRNEELENKLKSEGDGNEAE